MILEFLFISLAIQIALFIPAFKFKTDKLTDLSYGLTFVLLAVIAFIQSDMVFPKLLLLIMISVWGIRLGAYLFIRINKTKKDSRFDEIRIDFFKFLSFWVLQGVSVFVILLPSLFFFQSITAIFPLSFLGLGIWVIGILTEGFADQQKFAFINNPKNKGKWVNIGLWKYSRHPNYLGEILCWVGIYLYTYSSLSTIYRLIGLLGPLFIITLLLFVSGIPKLEEKADKKWGSNKEYQEYKKKTAVLIPFIY
jgi:steroid 5-alpha reductase family enzyme